MLYDKQWQFEVPKYTVGNYLIKEIGMLEAYINPAFRSEKNYFVTKMKYQFLFQVMDSEAFNYTVKDQKIKLSGNVYHKTFDLYAD